MQTQLDFVAVSWWIAVDIVIINNLLLTVPAHYSPETTHLI